jgi:hypothetical protein
LVITGGEIETAVDEITVTLTTDEVLEFPEAVATAVNA